MTDTVSDDALREIEARAAVEYEHDIAPHNRMLADIYSLCATVRALREDLRQGELCEECEQWSNNEDGSPRTFLVCGACWNKLQETNTALRAQLAQIERERDSLRGQIVGLNTQLAQVTQGLDDCKRRLRPMDNYNDGTI